MVEAFRLQARTSKFLKQGLRKGEGALTGGVMRRRRRQAPA